MVSTKMMPMNPRVDVVIPTKSNQAGLSRLLSQLAPDPVIDTVVVVCDGPDALNWVLSLELSEKVKVNNVPLSSGIHVMWNLGMDMVQANGNHVCFINDDVSIGDMCMGTMRELLTRMPEVGLITPNPTTEYMPEFTETPGFAGFCMMLAHDLVSEFRFDERMKWWYGDNDIITWVNRVAQRKTGITGLTSCSENQSYTITNDPPENFHQLIEEDARIYHEKWGTQ